MNMLLKIVRNLTLTQSLLVIPWQGYSFLITFRIPAGPATRYKRGTQRAECKMGLVLCRRLFDGLLNSYDADAGLYIYEYLSTFRYCVNISMYMCSDFFIILLHYVCVCTVYQSVQQGAFEKRRALDICVKLRSHKLFDLSQFVTITIFQVSILVQYQQYLGNENITTSYGRNIYFARNKYLHNICSVSGGSNWNTIAIGLDDFILTQVHPNLRIRAVNSLKVPVR